MKRRDFLKNMPLAVVPLLSNQLFANVMPLSPMEEATLLGSNVNGDKILVIIQLEGGNDGLNTVLPLDQYTNLAAARSNVLIPSNQALQLGSFQAGLHPAMTGMKTLYDANRLCVIQGVSYANPNFSHFRATDILLSGSDSTQVIDSGWAGRFLEYNYPGYPTGYPNTTMPDPLSIQIGSAITRGLLGNTQTTGQTVPWWFNGNITQLPNFTNSITPATHAGNEVAFLRNQQAFANQYANSIVNAWSAGSNTVSYPPNPSGNWSYLGEQLKVVARLIKGGLKTRIYWVTQYGYDTHSYQVNGSNHAQGAHANLLKDLSDCMLAFQTDLNNTGNDEKVMGMVFSEFGRTIQSNSSEGTDHGAVGPMFVFGKYVNPTILGNNPVIPSNVQWNTLLSTQYDYRQVYSALLQGWFCVPTNDIAGIIGTFPSVPATNTQCLSILPLDLVKFKVEKANQNDAHLEWVTSMEQNVKHFEIQRCTDGKSFKTVETVKAVGHSHNTLRYDALDKNLKTKNELIYYYRLKIVDNDESEYFSEIQTLEFENETKGFNADVFPNPNTGVFSIEINAAENITTTTSVKISDYVGRRVFEQNYEYLNATTRLDIDLKSLSANGIYFLQIENEAFQLTKKIVVQH